MPASAAGTIMKDSVEKLKADAKHSSADWAIAILKEWEEELAAKNEEIQTHAERVRFTSFYRLLGIPEVRSMPGFQGAVLRWRIRWVSGVDRSRI